MNQKSDKTEEKILEAAKSVFLKKGMEGARMQEIADEAGINKALVHYYFRSKEKLFTAIFTNVITYAFPKISKILLSDSDIITKIEQVIDAYIGVLLKHSYVPGFLMKELNRDPSGLFKIIAKYGFNPEPVIGAIQKEMDEGRIIQMDPRHLIVNIISMCVFPFAARPIVQYVGFRDDPVATQHFLEERAEVLKKFIVNAIVIKQKE